MHPEVARRAELEREHVVVRGGLAYEHDQPVRRVEAARHRPAQMPLSASCSPGDPRRSLAIASLWTATRTMRTRWRLTHPVACEIEAPMMHARWLSMLMLAAVVVLAASGCTYFRKQEADQAEDTLAAAGFKVKPADSAKREATLA